MTILDYPGLSWTIIGKNRYETWPGRSLQLSQSSVFSFVQETVRHGLGLRSAEDTSHHLDQDEMG